MTFCRLGVCVNNKCMRDFQPVVRDVQIIVSTNKSQIGIVWPIGPITGLEIVIEHLYLLARCTSTQGGRPKIEILWLFNIYFCFSPKSEWSMGQFQPKSGKKLCFICWHCRQASISLFFVSGCIFSNKVHFFKISPPLTQRISFIPSFFGVLGLTEQCLWRCSRGEPTKNYYLRNINSNHNF